MQNPHPGSASPTPDQRFASLHATAVTTLRLSLTHLHLAARHLAHLNSLAGPVELHSPSLQATYKYHSDLLSCLQQAHEDLLWFLPRREWSSEDDVAFFAEDGKHLEAAIRIAEEGFGMLVDSTVRWGWSEEGGWEVEGRYEWWGKVNERRMEWREALGARGEGKDGEEWYESEEDQSLVDSSGEEETAHSSGAEGSVSDKSSELAEAGEGEGDPELEEPCPLIPNNELHWRIQN